MQARLFNKLGYKIAIMHSDNFYQKWLDDFIPLPSRKPYISNQTFVPDAFDYLLGLECLYVYKIMSVYI